MGRDTYEELLLRMRESGLFSIKDDAYFEKCGEETIGCSFKSVKLTLCHRFSLYDSHFDNKSFAIFNSLGGLFPTECSFPSTVVTVEDLMQLSPQQIKRYLPKKKNRSDQAISKFYCKLLQCGVINHNETLKKCQSLPNIFDRIIYSCIKAMDNKAIEDFNLPQGITTSLINSQIYSFGELRAMTPNDLLNIPGIGPQKVNTINGFIANVWNGIGCHNEIEQKLTD